MALIETLTDDFQAGISAAWSTSVGSADPAQVVATSGTILTTHTAAPQYNRVVTNALYDFTGSAAYVQFLDVGHQNLATHAAEFKAVSLDASSAVWFSISNNLLSVSKLVAFVSTEIFNVAFDILAHRWLKIRESGGTTFFDTAPDGVTWTNLFSVANPITMTALNVQIGSGAWNTEATGSYAIFDNFNILDQSSTYAYRPPKLITPTRIGPKVLGVRFRPRPPPVWTTVVDFSGSSVDTTITVGLTSAGLIGAVAGASTTITAGLTSAGAVGAVGQSTTAVTAGLTAAGAAGAVTGATTAVTVGLTAAGAVGASTGTTTTITVGLTAAGAAGTVSASTATPVVVGLTAAGGGAGQASTPITVGLTAAGLVGAVGQATTTLTVGLTADGVIGVVGQATTVIAVGLTADVTPPDTGIPAAPLIIPNRNVGPMALRYLFHRSYWPAPDTVIDYPATSTDTTVTVGLTADGTVGTVSGASTAITVGLTASGGVGAVANTVITVGLTAAGGVGAVGQAASTVTVGRTSAGVAGVVGQATQTVTVGLTAAGAVGTASQVSTAVVVGLTAAGSIGNTGQATRPLTVGLTATGTVSVTGQGTASLATVVGLSAAGRVEIVVDPDRTFVIRPESRTCVIRLESRTAVIKPESRTVGIKPESRIVAIKPESQSVVVRR